MAPSVVFNASTLAPNIFEQNGRGDETQYPDMDVIALKLYMLFGASSAILAETITYRKWQVIAFIV